MDMKAIKVVSVLAMTVLFAVIGWELFRIWLFSLPPKHPYVWMHPHLIETLLVIPSIAFGISLVIYYTLLKPLSKRFQRLN